MAHLANIGLIATVLAAAKAFFASPVGNPAAAVAIAEYFKNCLLVIIVHPPFVYDS
jgi:hypothetical protein